MNRIVVGAHYGVRQWLGQRVTALIMALYTVLVVVVLAARAPFDHAAWKGLFTTGFMRVATLLFFLSLVYHAWVGMRDIFMDYVKATGLRLGLQVAVIVVLVGYAIWSVSILWGA